MPALPSAWGLSVPIAVPLGVTALELLAFQAQQPWDPVPPLSPFPSLGFEHLRDPEPSLLPAGFWFLLLISHPVLNQLQVDTNPCRGNLGLDKWPELGSFGSCSRGCGALVTSAMKICSS